MSEKKQTLTSSASPANELRTSIVLKYHARTFQRLAEAILNQATELSKIPTPERTRITEDADLNFYEAVKEFEINLIKYALMRTSGHQAKAARLLGLNSTTLNCMIKRYNIAIMSN